MEKGIPKEAGPVESRREQLRARCWRSIRSSRLRQADARAPSRRGDVSSAWRSSRPCWRGTTLPRPRPPSKCPQVSRTPSQQASGSSVLFGWLSPAVVEQVA